MSSDWFEKNPTAILQAILLFLIIIFKNDYKSSSSNETFTFVGNCDCHD